MMLNNLLYEMFKGGGGGGGGGAFSVIDNETAFGLYLNLPWTHMASSVTP